MPRTLSLLKTQLEAMGVSGQMELLVLSATTQELAGGTTTVVPVAAGVPRLLLKSIRVTSNNTTDTFEVEILTADPDGRVEYASLPMAGELYDTVDLPYVCATEANNVFLRIKPTVSMSFTIEMRAIKLK